MRHQFVGLIVLSLLLAGCGGGGDSSSTGSSLTTTGSTSSTATSSGATSSAATSSGATSSSPTSGSSTGTSTTATTNNVVNAVVDAGPTLPAGSNIAFVNIMYVHVTVCAPGSTTTCQTIDHVQVDTGSQGLRILSTALNSTMTSALQPITINGGALVECTQFVDGYSWGPMMTADVHVGGSDTATSGESAPAIPVQVIGTSAYSVPTACANTGPTAENTVASFGANGVLGVGEFDQDCTNGICSAASGFYYSCTSSSACTATAVPAASQATNPIYKFTTNNGVLDNNGVIVELQAVGATGAKNVAGTLVFGIGTQSNNALASGAVVLTTDSEGLVSTSFMGKSYNTSYFDSGSNAIYFNDSTIPTCTTTVAQGFMCPGAGVIDPFTATVTGVNNQATAISFSIADANTLFNTNPSFTAFSNLGGAAGTSSMAMATFAWGLPFYFGHNVYTAMENETAGGTSGPYFAF